MIFEPTVFFLCSFVSAPENPGSTPRHRLFLKKSDPSALPDAALTCLPPAAFFFWTRARALLFLSYSSVVLTLCFYSGFFFFAVFLAGEGFASPGSADHFLLGPSFGAALLFNLPFYLFATGFFFHFCPLLFALLSSLMLR